VRLARLRKCWRFGYGKFLESSGGDCLVEEPGERRALRLAARCPGIPFTKSEEVETGRDKDVAEMDFRLPAIAREPESAAADAAGECALDASAEETAKLWWAGSAVARRTGSLAPPCPGQAATRRLSASQVKVATAVRTRAWCPASASVTVPGTVTSPRCSCPGRLVHPWRNPGTRVVSVPETHAG